MAEYAGYVKRPTPINWGEVAGGIVKRMGDIEQEQAAFREKYDTMAAETSQKIGEYEAGKSKAFNNLVYDATAEGRSMLHEMHNKLKRGGISTILAKTTETTKTIKTYHLLLLRSSVEEVARAVIMLTAKVAHPVGVLMPSPTPPSV